MKTGEMEERERGRDGGNENESGATIKPNGLEPLLPPPYPLPHCTQIYMQTDPHTHTHAHILTQHAKGSYGACTLSEIGRRRSVEVWDWCVSAMY